MFHVGLLIPSSNRVFENDLHHALPPPRFWVHSARMHLRETTVAAETAMIETFAPAAADQLKAVAPDLVVFGCTSAGSLRGMDYDRAVCASLGKRAGAPCIGVLSAAAAAIRSRRWQRVAVVTPYIDELTTTIVGSLRESGVTVVTSGGMGISDNIALADPTPEDITAFARTVVGRHHVEGIFVSCTNFRAMEAMRMIEAELRVPVVTSNFAAVEAVQTFFAERGEDQSGGSTPWLITAFGGTRWLL